MGHFSRIVPGRLNRRGIGPSKIAVAAPFAGAWATLFPGAFQVVQTDLGLTYGGTLLAGGGATDSVTLTGSLATTPVPILALGTGVGTCNIYYDGGTTAAMTGVTPTAGVPVALTGAALGLSLTWTAATIANANTWTATCAGLADQSGNTKHYSQATASKQPILTVGLNGKPGLLFDGVSNSLVSLLNLPVPGTTPYSIFAVFRQPTWATNTPLFGPTGQSITSSIFKAGGTPLIFNRVSGTGPSNGGAALNTWVDLEILRSATASDPFKLGSTTVTALAGNAALTGQEIGSVQAGAFFGTIELLALAFVPGAPNWTAIRAAINSAAGYGVGSVLV